MPLRKLLLVALCAACALAGCAREKTPPPPPDLAPPGTDAARPGEPGGGDGETAPAESGEAARALVDRFMTARVNGDLGRAREYLSPTARTQYGDGESGLALTAAPGSRYAGWEVASFEAADASSFEVRVRIREERTGEPAAEAWFDELLFVGPGPDWRDTPQPWIVRGAQREAGDDG